MVYWSTHCADPATFPEAYSEGPLKVSGKGRFRIQSVAEMTGVPASTLRAWEQRYGFPSPERTASAYRVYSQADIDLIAAVRSRCDAGMAPAEAVAEVLQDGRRSAAVSFVPGRGRPVTPVLPGNGPLVDRIVAAARAPDPAALEDALRSALMLGSHAAVFELALHPAWSRLRELAITGELDAGCERIANEVLTHAARDLVRLGQPPSPTGYAVLAALPGEDDLVPLVGPASAAQARSLRAVMLSVGASAIAIGQAATHLDAEVVVIAATQTLAPRRAREIFDDIASRVGTRPWRVCGPTADELREAIEHAGGRVLDENTTL